MRRRELLLAALLLASLAACCSTRSQPAPARSTAAAAVPVVVEGETPARVREPAVAGSWYPDDRTALEGLIDGLLAAAPAPVLDGRVRALVAPHAGYPYSGPTAAAAFRAVRGQTWRRVIVLGPAHRGAFRGAGLVDATHFRTPLGDIPLDLAALARLRAAPLFSDATEADRREHSIEIELPFLQRALAPGWRLVPVLVGDLEPGDAERLADALRGLVDGCTLVVASGDFTHYGPDYGYVPFPADAQTAARLRELDEGAFGFLAARDADGFAAHRQRTGATVCGFHPFEVLIRLLPSDVRGQLLLYDSSGRRSGEYRNAVGYVGAAFTSPVAGDALSCAELVTLHQVAVRAVSASVRAGIDADEQVAAGLPVDGRLSTPSGAFVTLKKHGALRGCIGSIGARESLWRAVLHAGSSAALHDGRFEPVAPEELAALDVEVSVLSPLVEIPSYEEFRNGEQGVFLEKDGRSAVFLPEVAREQGWTRDETLSHLARKAGLPVDAWREGARFHVFTSQIFEAPLAAPRP